MPRTRSADVDSGVPWVPFFVSSAASFRPTCRIGPCPTTFPVGYTVLFSWGVRWFPKGVAAAEAAPHSGRKRYRTQYPRFNHLGRGFCWACGFPGHGADNCESERDVDGVLLPRLDYHIDARAGPGPDTAAESAAAPPQPPTSWDADIVLPYQCIRCGLGGHRRAECVEEVHKEGWALSPRPPPPI